MKNILFIAFLTLSVSAYSQTPNTNPKIKIYQPPAHTYINAMPLKTTIPPLLVLDGVVFHFEAYSAFENKIKDLNPDAIQSLDVIKDEKAVAQFGEQGQHGVIVVTSKKK